MVQYPLLFSASSSATQGVHSHWKSQDSARREAACAIPPEFGGPGGGYSPEDFFALAVINCFVATFKVMAEKSKASFQLIQVEGGLVVDRDSLQPASAPTMKSMHLRVTLDASEANVSSEQRERLLRLLQKTSTSCLVLRSIRTDVSFEFNVR